jgi:hypothetical protein
VGNTTLPLFYQKKGLWDFATNTNMRMSHVSSPLARDLAILTNPLKNRGRNFTICAIFRVVFQSGVEFFICDKNSREIGRENGKRGGLSIPLVFC